MSNALGCCWLVANLAALAGIAASLWQHVSIAIIGGWSAFVILNVVLHQALRAAPQLQLSGADGALLDTALGAVLGLAWGMGIALLLPHADGAALGVLFCAALAVALIAIPVLGEQPVAYLYFLATLGLLVIGGVVRDGHHGAIVLWIALAMATLLLVAHVYFRTAQALRGVTLRLLILTGAAPASSSAGAEQLARNADSALDDIVTALAREAYQQRLLGTLGDALLATDAAGHIDYANPGAEALLGSPRSELHGRPLEDCVRLVYGRAPHNRMRELFDEARLTLRAQNQSDQPQLIRRDGVVHGVDYAVTPLIDGDGLFIGVSVLLRDVTTRRQRVEAMTWQATHDALTGVINRGEFERRLHKLLSRGQDANSHAHTLLYIDIDKFKFINDTYGHAAGDHALRALTEVLRTRIRGADTLARIGGDEFCALLYSCNADRARLIGESVRRTIDSHDFTWQSIALPVSISIGIVEIDANCRSSADLLRAADAACYSAKHFGRNCVQMFAAVKTEDDAEQRSLRLVREIQASLHDGRLDLFYQPLCATTAALPSDRCEVGVGIRTLAEEFIPRHEVVQLAARYQLSADIDRWLLRASIEALRTDHPVLSDMRVVLVPLSALSVGDDRLLEDAIRMVREHPKVANRIGFTLHESVLATHPDFVRYFVTTLKQDGCQFMIGDLGFGGGAIDQIKSLQIDYLGIRGAFVRNLLQSSVDYEVVLGLCRVARALGMQTVAEHADSRALREALAKMGVDYAKGLLHDGPRRVARFDESLLSSHGERLV